MTYKGVKLPSTRLLVALTALILVIALPAQASAQAGDTSADPTASQYQNPSDNAGGGDDSGSQDDPTLTSTGGGDSGSGTTSSAGTLPFTGFDAGVLAIVALLLGATGLALRRMSAVR